LQEEAEMFGLIGKIRAHQGKRDAMLKILLKGTEAMPGCLSYVVAKDSADTDAIWITEVWEDEASHKASLSLPSVQAAIAEARPLIAGFDSSTKTEPVGGVGLPVAMKKS
jgi:quinol monooxygenase YgiN